jgi:hypothetical protein
MRGEGPLQGQLSNYGRTQKGEEQRQGANKCQNLERFFKTRATTNPHHSHHASALWQEVK